MQTTTYSLDRHDDQGELIETIELELVGEVVIAPPSRRGHPDTWHDDESYSVVHYARRVDTGEDILGQLDAHREELECALYSAVESGDYGHEPLRLYDRTAVLAAEVA